MEDGDDFDGLGDSVHDLVLIPPDEQLSRSGHASGPCQVGLLRELLDTLTDAFRYTVRGPRIVICDVAGDAVEVSESATCPPNRCHPGRT